MTARDFCYWLQGFFELRDTDRDAKDLDGLTPAQADLIRRHLSLVFAHDIDPKAGGAAAQAQLNALHGIGKKMPDGSVARC